jgi:hypothetical protein
MRFSRKVGLGWRQRLSILVRVEYLYPFGTEKVYCEGNVVLIRGGDSTRETME